MPLRREFLEPGHRAKVAGPGGTTARKGPKPYGVTKREKAVPGLVSGTAFRLSGPISPRGWSFGALGAWG
ncbi:MAG: hypothetical protein LBJ61_11820 [Deltaproteobacteria bacterium]|nr:hypothetical protein [Deltaproteobacteria bacterium]